MTNAMPAWIEAPIRDALVRGAFELEPTDRKSVV